jgi:hypothetical protein
MSKGRPPAVVFADLYERVVRGPGVTTPAEREAAAGTGPVHAALQKVRDAAYKVTNDDIAALKASGLSEDAIFELTIAAALGVSKRRLDAAMKAIDAAE